MMHCSCLDKVTTSLLITAINDLWSVMTHTSWQNSNGGTSLGHVVFQGHLFLYCCSATLHSVDFYWEKQLGTELHCLVPYHAYNSCHPFPAVIWLQG